jgi:RNA recognition motif-containing protein
MSLPVPLIAHTSTSLGSKHRSCLILPFAVLQIQKEVRVKNIFVGNLSFGTTEDTVRSMFASYGSVDRVNIVTDREKGQPRGFAFVEMNADAEGNAAISGLNGRDVDGRALKVNEARPKGERAPGGGGNRGNGGGSRQSRW